MYFQLCLVCTDIFIIYKQILLSWDCTRWAQPEGAEMSNQLKSEILNKSFFSGHFSPASEEVLAF